MKNQRWPSGKAASSAINGPDLIHLKKCQISEKFRIIMGAEG